MGRITSKNNEGKPYIIANDREFGFISLYGDFADKLAAYEDIIDDPEKLKLIDALYLERCEEINRLNKELEEYKKLEEEGHLLKLQINKGDIVFEVSEEGIEECEVEVLFISDYTDKNGTYCNMAEIYYLREDYPYSST